MNKKLRTLTIVSLVLGVFVSVSPLYAQAKAKPSTDHEMMMKGGNMEMMGMMEQMTKMMELCNKMMESKMDGDPHNMKMPDGAPTEPEKKS